ncbi:MAG: helix-turn-helix domain-containing protein [Myxococcales bacterium]|nr:helix-turn-helix domain-containing protein [Myxococcales bacterium]
MLEVCGTLVAEVTPPPELVDQHASPLGKSKHLRLVRSGELPAVKAGKRVLVRREDLDAWLAAHAAEPQAKAPAAPASGPRDAFADVLAELGATKVAGGGR